LELGCGPGEDAVWLASRGVTVTATDASAKMLAVTSHKAEQAGVAGLVHTQRVDLERIADWEQGSSGGFDGAYANFGPLNCVEDRRAVAGALARLVRPGGMVVLVVMGPVCPWEIAWHVVRLRPRTAFRRFRSGVTGRVGGGATIRVWYPSPGRLRRELEPHFRVVEHAGVGLLLPPSEMGRLVERAPGLFERIARLDTRFAGRLPWRRLNDHYLVVLERR
jgi:SAM-dependent methyltransferase